jgi:hypothetical protein
MNSEEPMPAKPRNNDITRTTVHRVYRLSEELRRNVTIRRHALGLSMRAFLAEAVAGELPSLVEALRAHLPAADRDARPARLPMTEALLDALRLASQEVGVPAARLLLACLARAAARKRRRPGAVQAPDKGTRKPRCRRTPEEKSRNSSGGEAGATPDSDSPENGERDCDAEVDLRERESAAEAAGEPVSLAIPA